jgi:hypothetical protein
VTQLKMLSMLRLVMLVSGASSSKSLANCNTHHAPVFMCHLIPTETFTLDIWVDACTSPLMLGGRYTVTAATCA